MATKLSLLISYLVRLGAKAKHTIAVMASKHGFALTNRSIGARMDGVTRNFWLETPFCIRRASRTSSPDGVNATEIYDLRKRNRYNRWWRAADRVNGQTDRERHRERKETDVSHYPAPIRGLRGQKQGL